MAGGRQSKLKILLPLTGASAEALMGRQSVRATFRLSERCVDAISIVATQLGIKQKSLFDHLIEDIDTLATMAQRLDASRVRRQRRVQKTFVLNRRTLESLEAIARQFNAPRDVLIETAVRQLAPIIVRERQHHESRKKILPGLDRYVSDGEKLVAKSAATMGPDDPTTERLGALLKAMHAVRDHLEDTIDKGRVLESFEFSDEAGKASDRDE